MSITCLFEYQCTSSPNPLELNTQGEITITAKPIGNQLVYCDSLLLSVPIGNLPDALCLNLGELTSDSGRWRFEDMKEFPGQPKNAWSKAFYNPEPETPVKEITVKLFAKPVNAAAGEAVISIIENTGTAPGEYSEKSLTQTVRKGPEPFYVSYFMAQHPETLLPCTEFQNSATIILNWKGSKGNLYSLYQGSRKILELVADTTFTLESGIRRNTGFILEARRGEDSTYSTLNLTVDQPDLTPKTAAVTEYLGIHDNGQRDPQMQLQVMGNATVAGELKVSGSLTAGRLNGDGVVPRGAVLMWSGDVSQIPSGWTLCDGSNGAPDLRGRFIVGYAPEHGDYNAIGKNGGSESVQLNVGQMPAHSHGMTIFGAGGHGHWIEGTNAWGLAWRTRTISGQTTSAMGYGKDDNMEKFDWRGHVNTDPIPDHIHGAAMDNTGGNAGHENRPPYYVLAFIMKL